MLDIERTPRRSPAWVLISMLGIAVFLWGLHYKLSLYQSHLTLHNAPAAKLLSQKERPSPVLKVSCADGSKPVSNPAGTSLSGMHAALRARAATFAAVQDRDLGSIPPLWPGTLQGRHIPPSRPRAPPSAA